MSRSEDIKIIQVPQRQGAFRGCRGRADLVRRASGIVRSVDSTVPANKQVVVCGICACASDNASASPEVETVPSVTLPESESATERDIWSTFEKYSTYNAEDMIEIGYVWKHLGIRGEVAIRIRTSFEDMRVGLAGPRYLMPSDGHAISLPADPLQPRPPLFQAHQRLARQKLQSGKTAWLALFDGCSDREAAEQLRYARVFMHRDDCPQLDASSSMPPTAQHSTTAAVSSAVNGQPPPLPAPPPTPPSTVPLEALHVLSAEEVRGFEAHLVAPACGGVRPGDDAAEALQRPGGAVCVGRVMDVMHDEGRFFDTSMHVSARGMADLPGTCPVFCIAFRRGLVVAPHGGLAFVESLPREELLHAEGAQELRDNGVLSNGATPLWIPNSRSGLLPLLPEHVLRIDHVAEVVEFAAPELWLKDHLAPRMVKRRPPRRTEKAKASMGNKYRKRRDKAFIRRKGKFSRLGRNMRKT